jgi:hypothetical protein
MTYIGFIHLWNLLEQGSLFVSQLNNDYVLDICEIQPEFFFNLIHTIMFFIYIYIYILTDCLIV